MFSINGQPNESTVTFEGCKYSVRPKFIGKSLELKPLNGVLAIYHNKEIVAKHNITGKRFTFTKDDYMEIMRSRAFKDAPDDLVEKVAEANLSYYDSLGDGL